jgi:hypothetical protein
MRHARNSRAATIETLVHRGGNAKFAEQSHPLAVGAHRITDRSRRKHNTTSEKIQLGHIGFCAGSNDALPFQPALSQSKPEVQPRINELDGFRDTICFVLL